jgi:peptide-methionine (S)-S-oxide reductase
MQSFGSRTDEREKMMERGLETATLGGGCFWCLEAAYEEIAGVESIVSGYSGGTTEDPSYEAVCSGSTGHAEVVRLTYDPAVIGYREILEVFFTIHDPTTLNRQGADVGTQYRSVIFYHDEGQRAIAEDVIRDYEERGIWPDPIVTEVVPAPAFHPAEAYHQEYFRRNSGQPYCRAVIAPKVAKVRSEHYTRLRRATDEARAGQVRPYLDEPRNPIDQGGIAD